MKHILALALFLSTQARAEGLREGDVLTELDGQKIQNVNQVMSATARTEEDALPEGTDQLDELESQAELQNLREETE